MNNPSIYFIEDLSRTDLELLAQLLSVESSTPQHNWLRDQAHLIKSFPPTLLRPPTKVLRLIMRLPFTASEAILCQTHKKLNSQLIRRIFMQITAECTTKVQKLTQYNNLAPNHREFLKRLQSINSLYMTPELYRVAFQAQPEDARFECVESGCEACILAWVGGSRECLVNLRSSALSRKRRSRPRPRILPLLEEWIDWTGDGDAIRNKSNILAREINKARREVRSEMRRDTSRITTRDRFKNVQPKNVSELQESAGDGGGVDGERYFESILIDFYKGIMPESYHLSQKSNTNSYSANLPEAQSMIHPAFRSTLFFRPDSGVFVHEPPSPSSVYSDNSSPSRLFFLPDSGIYSCDSSKRSSLDSVVAQPYSQSVYKDRTFRHKLHLSSDSSVYGSDSPKPSPLSVSFGRPYSQSVYIDNWV